MLLQYCCLVCCKFCFNVWLVTVVVLAGWSNFCCFFHPFQLEMFHQISSGYIAFCIGKDVRIYSFHWWMVKIVLIQFTNSKCTVLFVWLPDYKNIAFSVNVMVFMPWVRTLLVVSGRGVHGSGWVGLRGFFDLTYHCGLKKIQPNPTQPITRIQPNPHELDWVGLNPWARHFFLFFFYYYYY